ncbi:CoA transferase [Niveispirillum sp. KHB5.9]|uniref:CoA transferase n=1 Tax=Niveispirillum sp. KHB5.9 TaxID=3400269 RepID=UPI003A8B4D3F
MAILSGLTITECAAFIAGPFATGSLARLGAEVIRIDPIEGGIDQHRWPVTEDGRSLYWAGLNKGKKSVRIDIRRPEGRELAQALITAPGEGRGLFVTNFPATGWLDFTGLRQRRADLIMVNILGNRDGSTALDYTVNCAVGFPLATGPAGGPVNHVLPAWDFVCGQTAATALLAAERHRRLQGAGQLMRIALSDVALAVVADMGLLAEVEINGQGRERHGNHIFGAFGCDFATSDGRRLMVAAVSAGQWQALLRATGTMEVMAALGTARGLDLSLEGDRFRARDTVAGLLAPWFSARTLVQAGKELDAARACWGPYQSFEQLLTDDPRCSPANPLFARVDHPGIGRMLTAASPIDSSACEPVPPAAGPILGQHTDEVLADALGLGDGQLADLHDRGVIAGPAA